MPQYLKGNTYLLCNGCKKDTGQDEVDEKTQKDIKLTCSGYDEDDPKYKDFVKIQKLYLKYYDPIKGTTCHDMDQEYKRRLIDQFGVERVIRKKIFK